MHRKMTVGHDQQSPLFIERGTGDNDLPGLVPDIPITDIIPDSESNRDEDDDTAHDGNRCKETEGFNNPPILYTPAIDRAYQW
jgi:hypothetical protein